jgi:hypothetical protein
MTTMYAEMTEQQKREVRMYGVTVSDMREVVESSITLRHRGAAMMAASLMSDCQEMLEYMDGNDSMAKEDIRQAMNRAKWILFEYCSEI